MIGNVILRQLIQVVRIGVALAEVGSVNRIAGIHGIFPNMNDLCRRQCLADKPRVETIPRRLVDQYLAPAWRDSQVVQVGLCHGTVIRMFQRLQETHFATEVNLAGALHQRRVKDAGFSQAFDIRV